MDDRDLLPLLSRQKLRCYRFHVIWKWEKWENQVVFWGLFRCGSWWWWKIAIWETFCKCTEKKSFQYLTQVIERARFVIFLLNFDLWWQYLALFHQKENKQNWSLQLNFKSYKDNSGHKSILLISNFYQDTLLEFVCWLTLDLVAAELPPDLV